MNPVNLLKLNPEEFKVFLDSFDHVLSDCDGVVWQGSPLPGSGDFFNLMKKLGKPVHFVSNNSVRTRENYEAKFKATGIEDGINNLTIPSVAIAQYLKSVNFNKTIYSVCCAEATKIIKSFGFKCKEGPDVSAEMEEYVQYMRDDLEIGAVVFDADFKINLPKMQKAVTYLRRPDVLFLCGATDRYLHILQKSHPALCTGIFSDIVAAEVKREPIVLGKPGRLLGEFAMKRAGVTDASRVLFIGDVIDQDIGLGKACGFKTLLVMTNISKEEMLAHETLRPDYYADSLGSLVPLLQ